MQNLLNSIFLYDQYKQIIQTKMALDFITNTIVVYTLHYVYFHVFIFHLISIH